MATKKNSKRGNMTEGRDPLQNNRYLGADDAHGIAIVNLSDVPGLDIIGIEIQRIEPDPKDPEGCAGFLGYSPMFKTDDGYDTDDIHNDIVSLCKDYNVPIGIVIDRVAIAMIRSAK